MAKNKFRTQYEIEIPRPKPNTGKQMTETAGYIPPRIQIERMIEAGEYYDQWKRANFDYEDPDVQDDGEDLDPSRGYDDELEFAREALRALESVNKKRKESVRRKQAEKQIKDSTDETPGTKVELESVKPPDTKTGENGGS